MYKVASDLAQRRARQLWLADIGAPDFQALTPEEQRDSLVAKLKGVEAQLLKHAPKSEWRLALGQVKLDLQAQISAIRPKLKARRGQDVANRFVEVARERMTKPAFNAFMSEASRRAKESSPDPTPPSQSDD